MNPVDDYIIYVYIVIETYVILWFFFNEINKKIVKTGIQITAIIISLIFVFLFLNNSSYLNKIYSLNLIIEGLVMTALAIILLLDIVFDDSIQKLTQYPIFIITSGIFIFFGITFPINATLTYFSRNDINNLCLFNDFILIGYILFYVHILIFVELHAYKSKILNY